MRRHAPILVPVLVSLLCACSSSDDSSSSEGDTGSASDTFVDAGHDGVTVDSTPTDSHAGDTTSKDSTATDSPPSDSSATDSATDSATGDDTTVDDTSVVDTSVPDVVEVDTSSDVADAFDATPAKCKPTEHVCVCATGFDCLKIGVGCLAPSSPCP